jgi:hypothetical protein
MDLGTAARTALLPGVLAQRGLPQSLAKTLIPAAKLAKVDRALATGLVRPTAPQLPVCAALQTVLPEGLRRGNTVSVHGSVSLVLALIAAASENGSWCALVDLPPISAEAARDHGIDLSRLPLVPTTGSNWVAVVGALLDAFDIVVARAPARLADSELRRLASRTRQRGAVLMPFLNDGSRWPQADLRLTAELGSWSGIGAGYGRLVQREVTVTVAGRGQAGRPRSSTVLLPSSRGRVEGPAVEPLAPVVDITRGVG